MKRILPLLLLASTIASESFAQASATAPNWNMARFGIAAGGDIDMPLGLDHDYLISTARNVDFDNSDLPFSKGDLTRMDCDNGTFRIGASFSPLRSPNSELQVSLLSIAGRIDMVRYELGEKDQADFQWLEVNAENKETAVEVVYLARQQTGKSWNWYGGFGTNIGYSHRGKVTVKGYMDDDIITDDPVSGAEFNRVYDQRESINQRLFLQGGIGLRFLRKLEFGLEFRKGFGYRASLGGPTHFTFLKRSLGFSLRCMLF